MLFLWFLDHATTVGLDNSRLAYLSMPAFEFSVVYWTYDSMKNRGSVWLGILSRTWRINIPGTDLPLVLFLFCDCMPWLGIVIVKRVFFCFQPFLERFSTTQFRWLLYTTYCSGDVCFMFSWGRGRWGPPAARNICMGRKYDSIKEGFPLCVAASRVEQRREDSCLRKRTTAHKRHFQYQSSSCTSKHQ